MRRRQTRIVIQRSIAGNELAGTPAQRWEDVETVYGAIAPLSARELIQAQTVESQVSHTIETGFYREADPSMRLTVPDLTQGANQQEPERVFNVEGVFDSEERHRKTVWRCIEVM